MKRPRFKLLAVACIAMAGLTLAACSSSSSSSATRSGATSASSASASASTATFSTITPGVLTVGVVGTDEPGIIVSADGSSVSGIVGDIVNGFAAKYGLKVKVTVSSDYGAYVLDIEQHKVDIGAGLAYSTQRGKIIKYSVAWLDAPLMAITRAGFKYDGPSSVSPGKVGTGIGVAWAAALQQWNSSTKVFSSTSVEEQGLLSGEIDVALINGDAVDNTPFTPKNATAYTVDAGDFGIQESLIQSAEYSATACNDSSLMTAYDNYITSLDTSDTLSSIYTKYNSPAGSEPSSLTAPSSC
jgi:L-cystine transport system substrate-binding protein